VKRVPSMSPVVVEIRRVQDAVKSVLFRKGARTFFELFLCVGGSHAVGGVMPGRILERAIRGLRRDGYVRYNRSIGKYEIVIQETKS
jgi:hypothetical protein